jgi:hypothetical protein
VRTEYSNAESLCGAIERALDENLTNSSGTEQNNKDSFTSQQV